MRADTGRVFHDSAGNGDRHRHDHEHAAITACGERDGTAAHKDDCRNELPCCLRGDQFHDEIHGAELFDDRGKRPGKQQHDDRGNNVPHAVEPGFDAFSGGQKLCCRRCGHGHDAAEERRTQQKRDRVASLREKRNNKVQHEQRYAAKGDEHPRCFLFAVGMSGCLLRLCRCAQCGSGRSGAPFCLEHGAELPAGNTGDEHEHKGKNAVKAIGNGTKENLKSRICDAGGFQTAADDRQLHGDPTGYHGNTRHRRCGRVDDVREPFPGKPDFVCDRAEHGAGDQGVCIIVKEEQHAEKLAEQIGAAGRFHSFRDPFCRSFKAAGFHKHADQPADERAQDHHLGVFRIGGDADQLVNNARNDLQKLRCALFTGHKQKHKLPDRQTDEK